MGAPQDWGIGIIAGGDRTVRQPIENAEDSETQAWSDLSVWQIDTQDNKMVDMLLSNAKLVDRGVQMVMQATGVEYNEAKYLLLRFGSVLGPWGGKNQLLNSSKTRFTSSWNAHSSESRNSTSTGNT
jgi:N-acetylmuramic acid 6-phosphate (MurNAc-6-P) etherase